MKAKKLSKSLIAVVLTLILAIGCFIIPTAVVGAEGSTVTIKFHYLREDGNYENMSIWAWASAPVGKDGASYDFVDSGDPKGAVATVEVTDGSTAFGFIVRKNDWSLKDPDGDRVLDIGSVISGTIDVYCLSGKEEFEVVEGPDVVKGIKLEKATVTTKTTITYSLTGTADDITADDFTVIDPKGNALKINKVEASGSTGTITLGEELDYSRSYKIDFRGTTINLTMPEYFSSAEFEEAYTYDGNDLGATYSAASTSFRVWAPTAEKIELNIYDNGTDGKPVQTVAMTADVKGTWVAKISGDLNKKYYTYNAYFEGDKVNKDIVDPYARTVGVNGKRGEIIDLDSTDPSGWDKDTRHTYANPSDMSIYELHIRDFSVDPDSGIKNTGKYIAFTEKGTKDSNGVATGIDHLVDLGITSVHILPSYDFGSVDETKLDKAQYNWGYAPVNYNAPEGSYSTDPYNGEVRVNEYKQMVQALHNNNIGVIMDVVYNHTYKSDDYCFNLLVPGYFHRPGSNGSGCGNDVASERSMVRKYIVDSVAYWASEYNLDGFRFDLMGLIDVETMNQVRAALDKIDPEIYVYGEGWSLSTKLTKDVPLAVQKNADKTPGIAYFSDVIRDGIKGSVFDAADKGYVNGPNAKAKGNIVGMSKIKDGVLFTSSYATQPSQSVNYASCHDNLTLWDKINSSNADDSEEAKIKQNNLAAAIVFTSQGVPFLNAGEEFLRTKVKADGTFEHNSYASPDSVNLLDYSRITDYSSVYNYYKGLIAMRAKFDGFRMSSADAVEKNLSFVSDESLDQGVIAYEIKGTSENLFVIYNPRIEDTTVTLPGGEWDVYAKDATAGTTVLDTVKGSVKVSATTAMVLATAKPKTSSDTSETSKDDTSKSSQVSGTSSVSDQSSKTASQASSAGSSASKASVAATSAATSTPVAVSTVTPVTTGDHTPVMMIAIIFAAAGLVAFVVFKSSKRKTSK